MSASFQPPSKHPVPWIVVNTHPHREMLAIEHLKRQRFECYCPMTERLPPPSRAAKGGAVIKPLFPNYVFVRVDANQMRWRPILSTLGVRSMVRFGDRPSTLNDTFIAALKSRETAGIIRSAGERFNLGDTVRLVGGPFDGLVTKIIEMTDRDRLVVLMDLLNQKVKVKVYAQAVTAQP